MNSFSFGDNPQMANELLGLVVSGKKTGTCWAEKWGLQGVEVGKRSTIKDGAGKPRAIIETLSVSLVPFTEVDESFVRAEGEGDLSLGYWRKEHTAFFEREGTYSDDMKIYCERFKLVEVLP
jgi:uncharacterized protein YhfF